MLLLEISKIEKSEEVYLFHILVYYIFFFLILNTMVYLLFVFF